MCLFEYDEERHMRGEREIGRKEERIRMLVELVEEGTYTMEQASKKANMTKEEFEKILSKTTKGERE